MGLMSLFAPVQLGVSLSRQTPLLFRWRECWHEWQLDTDADPKALSDSSELLLKGIHRETERQQPELHQAGLVFWSPLGSCLAIVLRTTGSSTPPEPSPKMISSVRQQARRETTLSSQLSLEQSYRSCLTLSSTGFYGRFLLCSDHRPGGPRTASSWSPYTTRSAGPLPTHTAHLGRCPSASVSSLH